MATRTGPLVRLNHPVEPMESSPQELQANNFLNQLPHFSASISSAQIDKIRDVLLNNRAIDVDLINESCLPSFHEGSSSKEDHSLITYVMCCAVQMGYLPAIETFKSSCRPTGLLQVISLAIECSQEPIFNALLPLLPQESEFAVFQKAVNTTKTSMAINMLHSCSSICRHPYIENIYLEALASNPLFRLAKELFKLEGVIRSPLVLKRALTITLCENDNYQHFQEVYQRYYESMQTLTEDERKQETLTWLMHSIRSYVERKLTDGTTSAIELIGRFLFARLGSDLGQEALKSVSQDQPNSNLHVCDFVLKCCPDLVETDAFKGLVKSSEASSQIIIFDNICKRVHPIVALWMLENFPHIAHNTGVLCSAYQAVIGLKSCEQLVQVLNQHITTAKSANPYTQYELTHPVRQAFIKASRGESFNNFVLVYSQWNLLEKDDFEDQDTYPLAIIKAIEAYMEKKRTFQALEDSQKILDTLFQNSNLSINIRTLQTAHKTHSYHEVYAYFLETHPDVIKEALADAYCRLQAL